MLTNLCVYGHMFVCLLCMSSTVNANIRNTLIRYTCAARSKHDLVLAINAKMLLVGLGAGRKMLRHFPGSRHAGAGAVKATA